MDRLQFCATLLGGMALAALPRVALPQTPRSLRLDTPTAVDMAGRLRMLSQRSTKAYLQWGLSIAPEGARALLRDSVERFDAHLAALKTFQPTPMVQASLPPLETRWTDFKAVLAGLPSRDGAAALYDASELLQSAAHRTTVAYENTTGSPLDHLVGIAGRQRMLSQRMAKFYLYRAWTLHDAPADMELHLSRAHFTAVLTQLESSPRVAPPAKAAATRVRHAWEPYQNALFTHKDPALLRQGAVLMAEESERILAATEELVGLLVAQAQGQPL
ncbi:type IV pili methyl-accepting chemotaxis transducer N-terminal domain-containing protein [Simplicispira lacusdiani]|uniref:type IV pili methyl-accepting chemotaxis transducer N-terminal domain-containing protein n=1 Tax=Simplicispira lacusdiani TaxID=2213010 RepID=UPI0013006E7D|nr:type IV pili methyl-accepting chemotaxis transducer N-terminal domain-containing protein [Simplicispira lacusdiani]